MKKEIALLAAAALGIGICGTAYSAEQLTGTSPEVEAAAEAGILIGTGEGYELERHVTRAEALMFIWRLTGAAFIDIGYETPLFIDTEGHWGYDVNEKFVHAGYVDGVGNGMFAPDRNVTAREFMKIFLSTENGSAGDITIGNVYEKAQAEGYLNNDIVKLLVETDDELTRSDAVRLCADILGVRNKAAEDIFTEKILAEMPDDKNYMISPLSIKTAFAMLANGARGETQEQLLNAFDIDDIAVFNESIKADIERYGSDEVTEFDIANSIWMFPDVTSRDLLMQYTEAAENYYSAEVNKIESSEALGEMNGWVSENTIGKITQIMDSNAFRNILQNGVHSMLLNTVYFKGAWQEQFDPLQTSKDVFTDRNGDKKETDFMHDTSYYNYYGNDKMQIIELPYSRYNGENKGDLNISMYAVKGDYGFAAAEYAIGEMSYERIDLSFPKFITEYDTDLIELMKAIGAENVFDPRLADLGGMYSGDIGGEFEDNPYIQYASHKTYIDVNEKGTEAVAVTAIAGGGATSVPPPPIEVKYDTPFMYIIRDNDTGTILFAGEYAFIE